MPWSALELPLALPGLALVLFRVTGLVMTAPLFAGAAIPRRVRAGFIMVAGMLLFPLVIHQVPVKLDMTAAIIGGVGELIVGGAIGLAFSTLLAAAEVAGWTVGHQAGLALGQIVDPFHNDQVSTLGQIYSVVLVILFLLVGGHRAMTAALLDTFEVIPLLSFHWTDSVLLLLSEVTALAFSLGLRLAGPALIALFLTATALGLLSRAIPQLHILSVGFTVKALVAIGVCGAALMICDGPILAAIFETVDSVREAFGLPESHRGLVN